MVVQIWRDFSYAVPVFLAAALLAGLVVGVIALRGRQSETASARSALRTLTLDTLTGLWLVGLVLVTVLRSRVPVPRGSVELVPLRGIFELLTHSVWWQVPATQIGGNIAMFVPAGVLLAWRGTWSVGRIALVGGGVSVAIETAQFVLAVGVASVDDVLLALLGTLIGAAATGWVRARTSHTHPALGGPSGPSGPAEAVHQQ